MRKKKPNPWIVTGESDFKVEKGMFYLLFREIVLGKCEDLIRNGQSKGRVTIVRLERWLRG